MNEKARDLPPQITFFVGDSDVTLRTVERRRTTLKAPTTEALMDDLHNQHERAVRGTRRASNLVVVGVLGAVLGGGLAGVQFLDGSKPYNIFPAPIVETVGGVIFAAGAAGAAGAEFAARRYSRQEERSRLQITVVSTAIMRSRERQPAA